MKNNNDFSSYQKEINGTRIEVVVYKIESQYFCHISNAEAGPTIARAKATTATEAEKVALEKATRRLT